MDITTFECKNCGANVAIPDSPGTVICTYCGSTHRVSFHDGSVSAELIEKVRRLDEDVARLKEGPTPRKKPLTLPERLEMIAEGKRKWHEYFSSAKAGESKNSPKMLAVFNEAHANLIGGYGPTTGPLIEDAYGAKLVGVDPPGGYSCLFMMLAIIILSAVSGAVVFHEGNVKVGIILLAVGVVGVVAGTPFVIVGIRADKRDIAKRNEALQKLNEIEREIRRRLGTPGRQPS
jgi:uncharacterized Zn finger protein (UPF0148 family)